MSGPQRPTYYCQRRTKNCQRKRNILCPVKFTGRQILYVWTTQPSLEALRTNSLEEFLNLTASEQQLLLKRLIHYALNKMRKLRWRGARYRKGGSPPKGMEPEDFALSAIEKLLSGDRTWNREVDPTVEELSLIHI